MTRHTRKLRTEQLEKRELLAADIGINLGIESLFDAETVEVASVDGSGNNLLNTDWGSTDSQLFRIVSVEYADGVWTPAAEDRLSAREISNLVSAQSDSVVNDRYLTDLVWLWGQFVDHDIDLTGGGDPTGTFDIAVPAGDEYFDPLGTGSETIGLTRSIYDPSTGHEADDPRQQINQITAYLDASVVYGSDQERSDALRTFEGGRLKTSEGDLLPFNVEGFENAGGTSDSLFLAGDIRANENAALTAMQTLWVREHNRLADEISASDSSLNDEDIYQRARTIVRAEIQAITFNEFLPVLLGKNAIDSYEGYDPSVYSGISNLFSTASYRFGHSMLSSELLRLNNDGTVSEEGNLSLRDAFFAPQEIVNSGIDSLLLGAANQLAQEVDTLVIDDVRNFLFGEPGEGGFDLVSLNIQRGRDHGLADYNQVRIDLGLAPVTSFDQITSNAALALELENAYGTVDNIDVWVGGLAEDHVPGASVGELIQTVLVDQFERIRDGDRFWYQNIFSGRELAEIERTTLADVIMRNTDIDTLGNDVFVNRPDGDQGRPLPDQHPKRDEVAPRPLALNRHLRGNTARPQPRVNRELIRPEFQPENHRRQHDIQVVTETTRELPDLAHHKPERGGLADPGNLANSNLGQGVRDIAALDLAFGRMRSARHR